MRESGGKNAQYSLLCEVVEEQTLLLNRLKGRRERERGGVMAVTVDKANLTRPGAGNHSCEFTIAVSFAAFVLCLVHTSYPLFTG